MHLQSFSESESMDEAIASHIIKRIKAFSPTLNKKFVMVLPGDQTLLGVYQNLQRECRAERISFEHVVVLCLSEYLGVSPMDPNSQQWFMDQHFFSQVDIPPAQTHCLPGVPIDNHGSSADCAAYESTIISLGGISLSVVNLGSKGQIGLNGPGSSLKSRTREVSLPPSLDKKHVENPPSPSSSSSESNEERFIPTHGLTMGLGTILDSAEILIVASSSAEDCTKAFRDALEGGVNHLLHEDVTVFANSAAVSALQPSTITYLTSQLPIIVHADNDVDVAADPSQHKYKQGSERKPPSVAAAPVGAAVGAKHGLSPILEFPTALQLALNTLAKSQIPKSKSKSGNLNVHVASVLAQELVNGHTTSPPAPAPAADSESDQVEEKENKGKRVVGGMGVGVGVGRERGAGKGVGKTGLRVRTDFPFPPIPPPKPQPLPRGHIKNQREGDNSNGGLASVLQGTESNINVNEEHVNVKGEDQGDSFHDCNGDGAGDAVAHSPIPGKNTDKTSPSASALEQDMMNGYIPQLAVSANGDSISQHTPAPSHAVRQSHPPAMFEVTSVPLQPTSKINCIKSPMFSSGPCEESHICSCDLLSKGEIGLDTDTDDEEDDQGPGM